ncbi:hypothetical protein [Microbacterium sp. H6]|uniref:hypothetical protein n=1 Tax=Microbacterium sp. H6 TaxID=421122 RepID=UPI000DE1AD69|nr:hypothetical protein [Microbacterium sp. H6]RBO73518.1 hypothetical protein DSP71_05010 [Microbacterium sp. H6]
MSETKTPAEIAADVAAKFPGLNDKFLDVFRGWIVAGIEADRAQRAPSPVYAAVIEWPEEIADRDPALILAHSMGERAAGVVAEIREVSDLLTDPEWRAALADIDSMEWPDCTDALEATRYGSPFVTTYERDI